MTKYEQEVILRNSEFLYFSKSGNGKGAVKTNIEDGGFIYFSREDTPSIEIVPSGFIKSIIWDIADWEFNPPTASNAWSIVKSFGISLIL